MHDRLSSAEIKVPLCAAHWGHACSSAHEGPSGVHVGASPGSWLWGLGPTVLPGYSSSMGAPGPAGWALRACVRAAGPPVGHSPWLNVDTWLLTQCPAGPGSRCGLVRQHVGRNVDFSSITSALVATWSSGLQAGRISLGQGVQSRGGPPRDLWLTGLWLGGWGVGTLSIWCPLPVVGPLWLPNSQLDFPWLFRFMGELQQTNQDSPVP